MGQAGGALVCRMRIEVKDACLHLRRRFELDTRAQVTSVMYFSLCKSADS